MALKDIGGDIVVEWHDLVSYAMLAIVFVHISGVIVSSLMHRENLVRAMLTGCKKGEQSAGIIQSYAWLGAIIILAAVLFWYGYSAKS
jgi:cytochrome b